MKSQCIRCEGMFEEINGEGFCFECYLECTNDHDYDNDSMDYDPYDDYEPGSEEDFGYDYPFEYED